MLVTSTPDGPATYTCRKIHIPTDTTQPTDVKTTLNIDKLNAPSPFMDDWKDTLQLVQRTNPCANAFQNGYSKAKHLPTKLILSFILKVFSTKHVLDSNQKFLAIVIPKSWHFTVLIDIHDKLGHQGVNQIITSSSDSITGKGMNKDIHQYITNCALYKREKARTQLYPLQMTNIWDRHFDKIAIDLVSNLNISKSGNEHILTIIDHLTGWPEAFPVLTRKDLPLFMFWSIIIYPTSYCLTMGHNSRTN